MGFIVGAVPVTSTLPTLYNDLATGVGEGNIIFPSAQAGGFKFYEVAPYWKVMGFGAMAVNITINLDTLKKFHLKLLKSLLKKQRFMN